MPSSEAMARQFVHGKRFFLEEFGVENREAWLPDTFGFAGGLPQIIKAAGSKWLLTQKISWSATNSLPAPHLPVGGNRRHPGLHPFPADRHVQLLDEGPGDRARRAQLQGEGQRRAPLARPDRLRRRRRRYHPRDDREGRAAARPGGLGEGRLGAARRLLRQGRGRVPGSESGPAGVDGRALPRAAPRHAHHARPAPSRATGAARTCCARPSCGPRLLRCGSATRIEYPYAALDRHLEGRADPPVPRHPPGLVDRLGAPRDRAGARRGRRGTERHHRQRAARARRRSHRIRRNSITFNPAPHARHGMPAGGAAPTPEPAPAGGCTVTEREGGGYRARQRPDPRRGGRQRPAHLRLRLRTRPRDDRRRAPRPTSSNCTRTSPTPGTPGTWTSTTGTPPSTSPTSTDVRSPPTAPAAAAVRITRSLRRTRGSHQTLSLDRGRPPRRHRHRGRLARELRSSSSSPSRSTSAPTGTPPRPSSATCTAPTHVNTSWEAAKFEACNHKFVHFEEPG